MSLKQILQLKDKKVVYVLEENYSTYTYRKRRLNVIHRHWSAVEENVKYVFEFT